MGVENVRLANSIGNIRTYSTDTNTVVGTKVVVGSRYLLEIAFGRSENHNDVRMAPLRRRFASTSRSR